MTNRRTIVVLALSALIVSLPVGAQAAQWYEDLTIEAKSMRIDFVDLDDRELTPRFDRDQLSITAGRGSTTFGLIYQDTTKGGPSDPGNPEQGLMAYVGYDRVLSQSLRVDLGARFGLLGTDEHQPLYAEDSDVRANLVWFDSDGAGFVGGQPLFPSAYVGTVVNRFGRVQAVGGVGLWWKKIGLYGTAFHSFNGDDPIFDGVSYGEVNFANLENQGYSVSASYEWRAFEFRVKQNFALENGSDDLSFAITFRHNANRSLEP